MIGLEAGQSAFGDTYAWFKNMMLQPIIKMLSQSTILQPAILEQLIQEMHDSLIPELSKQASLLPLDEKDELALDWFNGRRTPDANQFLKSSINGLSLSTNAAKIFKALVEATCFGAKMISDRFIKEGVPVKGLIGLGGVARRSPYIMQVMSNVMNMPIRIHKSEQTCALGAAMFAATAAGIYQKVEEAMVAMGQGFDMVYTPEEEKVSIYKLRFEQYKKAGTFIEQNTTK
jgi:L-ribulokinase